MKLFIAILLFSARFIPADFHPIDEFISLELTDLTESSYENSESPLQNKTKTYDGDLVKVSVENTGNLSEHIGFQVYLPEQIDLLQFKSLSSGPKGNPLKSKKGKSSPLQHASFTNDEVNVHEMQTASTRSTLKSRNEIDFTFNYEVESMEGESKQTNQFLAILDIFSDHPEQLQIKLSSANFGYGYYPEGSKHRWLIRTHAGHSLSLDMKNVDVEKDLDTITVYDVQSSGNKKLLSEVNVAKQLNTLSNHILVVFKSDCSVNRGGFSAVVNVARDEPTSTIAPLISCGVPEDLENGYFVISDGNEVAKENVNVTYYCNENYTMNDDAVPTLTCSYDGSFRPLLDFNFQCKPDPIWSDWEEGTCSTYCGGGGSATETRVCIHGNCEGISERTVDCNRDCTETYKTCGSGVQNKTKVKDDQITASSFRDWTEESRINHAPWNGRLFGQTGVAAWRPSMELANEWIQADYLTEIEVSGIATQGRGNGEKWPGHEEWVESYTVSYQKEESDEFHFITDESGEPIVFGGNSDQFTVVAHQFPSKITGRIFRINPKTWYKVASMRFDFLVC